MRWRSLRNIILVLVSIGMGVFLSSLLLLSLYEDEFGAAVVDQLKKNVKGELTIEDQSFTIWRSFPLVSCDLRKVEIRDLGNAPIIQAEILGLRLNLYNIIRKSLQIENVLIRNGHIKLEYDKNGRSNLEFLTEKDSEEPGYFQDLELDYVRLENMTLSGKHVRDDWDLTASIDEAELNYRQSSGEKSFKLYGELDLDHFRKADWTLDRNLALVTEFNGHYEEETEHWQMRSKKLRINDDRAELVLNWPPEQTQNLNLDFTILEGNFEELLQILFAKHIKDDEFRVRGQYALQLTYSGDGALDVKGEIKEGYFEKRLLGEALENISTHVAISKAAGQPWDGASFKVHDLKLSSSDLNLRLQAEGKNLAKPEAEVEADGTLSLKSLLNLFDPGPLEVQRGIMSARGLSFYVQKEAEWGLSRLNGELLLEQILLKVDDHKIKAEASKIELKNEGLVMVPTEGSFNGDAFRLGLRIPSLRKSMSERRIPLAGELKMEALAYEELKELITAFQSEKNDSTDTTGEKEPWTVGGQLLVDLETFWYDKIGFSDCTVDLEFDKNQIDFFFETSAFEGSFKGNGWYDYEGNPGMELHLLSQQIEIKKLLEAFDDFDQEVITYKNIKGKTDAHSVVRAFWNEQGEHLMDELEVYSDLDIQNGELLGVDMLYQFSNWMKLRDLMHIKFSRLQNRLEISDERIYIPHMFVQSNAMNLSFAGEHSFENEIDYSFKINAGQVLWNKVRKYEADKSPLPARKDGMFNMFFKLRGTVEEYEVENDRSAVRTHFKNSLVHEEIIYNELRRAFPGLPRGGEEPEMWMDMGLNSDQRANSPLQSPRLKTESLARMLEKEEFIEGF